MSKILKNTTGSNVSVSDVGIRVPASGTYTIQPQDYALAAASSNLVTLINAGTLVVNDGITDLSAVNGIDHLKMDSFAFGTRFLASPERANSFSARNVQEAIEEARNTAIGRIRFTIVTTFNATVGNNTWLGYSELLPGNSTPIRLPVACTLKELSFSWTGVSVDGTYRIYKNGTAAGNIIYTTSFTNQNGGAQITGVNLVFAANDFYSGFWLDNGDNPSDMAVVYYFEVS